jgi:hypothetical protein
MNACHILNSPLRFLPSRREFTRALRTCTFVLLLIAGGTRTSQSQQVDSDNPSTALAAAISAACRADETKFATYLTADSAAAFRALTADQRTQFVRRFSLSDNVGKPLLSAGPGNYPVVRCETPQFTIEFHFGEAHVRENLAFIPVDVVSGEKTQFGLIRENGAWRLLSLGLVLLDVPQLAKEWAAEAAQQELATEEDAVIDNVYHLRDAIETYRRAFGMLPETLAKLGPAPENQISPDQANLADAHLAAGSANGYAFRYRITSNSDGSDARYELSATPENYGKSGVHSFFLDAGGKMHAADRQGATASSKDPVVSAENTTAQQQSDRPGIVNPNGDDSNSPTGGNSGASYSSSGHTPPN